MKHIKKFIELSKHDAHIAGGKGASLGEMLNSNIPVPDGYVVTADTFDQFLAETDLTQELQAVLNTVDTKAIHTVEHASEKIQAMIKSVEMPEDIATEVMSSFTELDAEYVAVRSSATAEDGADHAWAGQLDSYLNTTKENLLEMVQSCWASLFTPRAIFYRYEKGLHTTHISVAVVIQKMVNSEKSGIAFSVHPVTEDYNQIIIEAGLGLGEAIVSGSVTPDSYVITKEPQKIIDINVNAQNKALYRGTQKTEHGFNEWKDLSEAEANIQVLSEEQALELSNIIITIENHYGFPCDIEWAFENETFYIVQSRPITTLKPISEKKDIFNSPELNNLDYNHYQFMGLWPTNIFSGHVWLRYFNKDLFDKLGFDIKFGGILNLQGNFFGHKDLTTYLNNLVREDSESSEYKKYKALPELADTAFESAIRDIEGLDLSKDKKQLATDFQMVVQHIENLMTYWCLGYFIAESFEPILAERAVAEKVAAEHVAGMVPEVHSELAKQQKDLGVIKEMLEVKDLLSERDNTVVIQKIKKDETLSIYINKHLEEFGWIEFANHLGNKLTIEKILEQVHLYKNHKSETPNIKVSKSYRKFLDAASCASYVRQTGFEYSNIIAYKVFDFLVHVSNILELDYEDMLGLIPDEIVKLLEGELDLKEAKQRIEERGNDNYLIYTDKEENLVISTDIADLEYLHKRIVPKPKDNQTELSGQIGNKGKVTGYVKIIKAGPDFHKFEEGDILVTTMTTPDFVVLMQKSKAIITDIGGLLSHASIVSRELNKPCVIGTKFATQILKDGDLVEVDADNGVVKILDKQQDQNYLLKDRDDYVKVVKRPYPPLLLTLIIYGQVIPEYFDHYISDWPAIESFAIVGGEDIYYVKSELKLLGEKMFQSFQDPDIFKKSVAQFETNEKILLESINTTYEEFTDAYERYTPALQVLTVQGLIKDTLEQKLKEKTTEKEALELMDTLNIPLRDNGYKIEMRELAETDDLETHVNKYRYVGARYGSRDGYTVEEAQQKKTGLDIDKIKEEDKHEKAKITDAVHRAKELLDSVDENLVDVMQWIVYYRTQRTDILNRSSFEAYDLFETKAQELGLTYNELILCTRDEVIQKNIPTKDILRQRGEQYSMINVKEDIRIYHGKDSENIIEFFKEDLSGITKVTGQVASKGIVQGTVRNIETIHDLNKLKDGEVLITSMTTPDMVSAMGRAIAFVTDEGGITCHAAIMSRELKKPCIIGTEIATKVFHDGDLVEVDADNGIVTIIKSLNKADLDPAVGLAKKYIELINNRNLYPPLNSYSAFLLGSGWNTHQYFEPFYGNNVSIDTLVFMNKDESFAWFPEDDMLYLARYGLETYLKDKDLTLDSLENVFHKKVRQIGEIYSDNNYAVIAKKTESELISLAQEIRDIIWSANGFSWISITFDEKLCWEVVSQKIPTLTRDRFEEIWNTASIPVFRSFHREQEIDVLNLLDQDAPLSEIAEKLQYITTDYHSARTIGIVQKEIEDNYQKYIAEPELIKEFFKQDENEFESANLKFQDFLQTLNVEERLIAEHIQLVMELRDDRKNFFAKGLTLLYRIAEKFFDLSNINHKYIPFYTFQEMILGVDHLEEIKTSLIERENGFVLLVPSREKETSTNDSIDNALEIIKSYFAESNKTDDENVLSGSIASPGVATGIVRVIVNMRDHHEFNNGDVLVTGMTRPEFVPLMKQAAAIVTDEGGVTSHAAIISRELGTPCVIGTRIATQRLKDGDLVEVDANNGIVRIIKK